MKKSDVRKSARKLIAKVREKVEQTHWVKGDYWRAPWEDGTEKETGCLVGLCNLFSSGIEVDEGCPYFTDEGKIEVNAFTVRSPRSIRDTALSEIFLAIKEVQPSYPSQFIENFNDDEDTTREDILKVLDRADERLAHHEH